MTSLVFNILNNTVKELAVSRFEKPTLVQELAIPKVIEGKNVLVISGTGLGKTEAVMLGIFSKLVEKIYKPIAVLYITPMKSLNRDLLDRLVWWCNKLELDISVRHGDTTAYERKLQLEYPPSLLISTPEQIGSMIIGKRFKEHLKNVKYVIIDEIHELVNSKRGVQLTLSLERLKKLCGEPQIVCLSATIGSPEVAANFVFSNKKYEIVNAIQAKDFEIKVESPYPTNKDKELAEKVFIGEGVAARLHCIYDLIQQHRSALTFTNTREAAEILSSRLRLLDNKFSHDIHHSSLSKEVRIKAEKDFKQEKVKSLICTSSLQLGIDIGSIDCVLQYQSPRTVTQATQRFGRSGHGIGRISKGIIVSGEGDDIFESAVIARKALKGELEKLKTHKKCLDVLAHQIIGLSISDYGIDPKIVYQLIKNSNPFSDLSEKEFMDILNFLDKQLNLIFIDKGIKRRRRAFEYYFENLSVIPDSKNYKIIDMTANSFVGTLDEEFIINHGESGSTFIVKGRPWKIISVDDEKIYVEPVEDIESAIPGWEGELIPVPFEVVQEVCNLRKEISKMNEDAIERIREKYPVSFEAAEKMTDIIRRHVKKYPLPDENSILFESFGEFTVMHSPFGTLVNETLSRFISAILSAEHGEPVVSRIDPYRMIFRNCSIEDIKKVLSSYKPEEIQIILEKSLSRSNLFKWRFVHVAKRFGAIKRGASLTKINIDRIIDSYWNSPIHKETLNEIFTEKLDLERTKDILQKIQNNKINISETQGLSPLAELGFRYELYDVVKPERPEKEIFKIFKKRLLNTKVKLLCINCGKYFVTKFVNDVEEKPRCSFCQSKLLAALRPYQIEAQSIVKKWLSGKELEEDESKKLDRIKRSADLVINYGKEGIICIAGRGIGPETAFRILAKYHKTEDDLFKEILKAEKVFIATKKFWS